METTEKFVMIPRNCDKLPRGSLGGKFGGCFTSCMLCAFSLQICHVLSSRFFVNLGSSVHLERPLEASWDTLGTPFVSKRASGTLQKSFFVDFGVTLGTLGVTLGTSGLPRATLGFWRFK